MGIFVSWDFALHSQLVCMLPRYPFELYIHITLENLQLQAFGEYCFCNQILNLQIKPFNNMFSIIDDI